MGSGISRFFSRKKQQPIRVENIQQELNEFNARDAASQTTNVAKEPSALQQVEVPVQQPKDNVVEEPYEIPQMMEAVIEKPPPVNADELIEEGRVKELMDAILSNAEIQCRWEPVNYAARCGQFELVNWLMVNNLTDLKSC